MAGNRLDTAAGPALSSIDLRLDLLEPDDDITGGWLSPKRAVVLGASWLLTLWLAASLHEPLTVRVVAPIAVVAIVAVAAIVTDPMHMVAATESRTGRRLSVRKAATVAASTVVVSAVVAVLPPSNPAVASVAVAASAVIALTATDFRRGARPLRIACFCSAAETQRLFRGLRGRQ